MHDILFAPKISSKMISKSVIFALFCVAIAVASYVPQYPYPKSSVNYAANKSHHLINGSRLPGDHLVVQQYVVKSSSWLQVVTVEKKFNVSKYQRITQVQCLDQKSDGTGAYPSIVKDGPGTSNVTIKFKSQRGHGINFLVLVYAR